jgi:hypothetical protein
MNVPVVTVETKPREKTGKLDEVLTDAVNETLQRVFKEIGTEAIYSYIENNCHLKRQEIAEEIDVFSAGLEKLLGSAAMVIEKMILKNLYDRLELRFEEKKGYEFSEYVKELKRCERGNRSS